MLPFFALLIPLATAPALADDSPAEAEKKPSPFAVSGVYTIWGLSQHNFLLGADNPLDDAAYVVQMLRVNASFNKEHYGVVTRLDAAQGWWGTDNSPDTDITPTTDEDGAVTGTTTNNPYKLFGSKDTNYSIHVDHAYAWVEIPKAKLKLLAGRQPFTAGHKLVLDEDLDGVDLRVTPTDKLTVDLMWSKISEGQGSIISPTGALMSDEDAMADADLFGGTVSAKTGPMKLGLFGYYYMDRSGDGTKTLWPNGLGYTMSRFRPNISTAMAFGLTADGSLDLADGLDLAIEGDFLSGTDDVKNADHAGGLLDINDGTLSGWNAYLAADQHFAVGVPMRVGLTFGMGSGDDDVTSGHGNLNKLSTQGFFAFTNVWEDSVMPDIEGISPQGLGSPVSRGYREFENTTAVQARVGIKPHEKLDLELSYSYLMATRPVHGWDATGTPTAASSSDLGMELDANAGLVIWKGFSYKVEFGYFIPGDAAALLIGGSTTSMDAPWEIKQVVAAKF